MAVITKDDVAKIAKTLGARKVTQDKESYRLKIVGEENASLSLVLYPEALLGKNRGALITVYTPGAHLQLHNCSGYVISEELGEVTFVSETKGQLSGIVIGRDAFASEYAAVSRDLISSDFTQLGVEVMLSGVAMSLAEEIVTRDDETEKPG
ncbi:MAG TPA: hypothetical protein VLB27_11495 [candidate division Zixibacteria bacterium]|nr:hypothetical protein [candidate division Zixibacteria bacterium]